MSDRNDESHEIEMAEAVREGAKTVRRLYNAYLAEGFSEAQALELCKAALSGAQS